MASKEEPINNRQKKIINLLSDSYINRIHSINIKYNVNIPYTNYETLINCKQPERSIIRSQLFKEDSDYYYEKMYFNVQYIKRCQVRRKYIKIFINKLSLPKEILCAINNFIGIETLHDLFGPQCNV